MRSISLRLSLALMLSFLLKSFLPFARAILSLTKFLSDKNTSVAMMVKPRSLTLDSSLASSLFLRSSLRSRVGLWL